MANKYLPLNKHLISIDSQKNEVILTFSQIENILKDELPYSAKVHRAWWSNETSGSHVHARAWMDAGWKVDSVNQKAKWVKFQRSKLNISKTDNILLTGEPPVKETISAYTSNLKNNTTEIKVQNQDPYPKTFTLDNNRQSAQNIVLISCSKSKLDHPARAEELYISPLFKSNLAYAKSLKPDAIFILSAKYGLVALDQKLAPYEKTLIRMGVGERKAWAKDVLSQLIKHANLQSDLFIFLAGVRYREYLIPSLKHYQIPLEGLSFGKQLQELKRRLA